MDDLQGKVERLLKEREKEAKEELENRLSEVRSRMESEIGKLSE